MTPSRPAARDERIVHGALRAVLPLLFLVLLAVPATAVLVSPGRAVVEGRGTHDFAITVREQTGTVSVRAEGDLAQHITLRRAEAVLEDERGEARFEGTIAVPDDIDPGDHDQRLIVTYRAGAGDVVGASVELVSLLVVRKPYEGAYLVADAYAAPDTGLVDTANAYLTIENRGIAPVTPTIALLREDGDRIDVPAHEIGPSQAASFTTVLRGHGEETLTLEVEGAQGVRKEFTAVIGQPSIEAFSAYAPSESGAIRPIRVTAIIDWNRPVPAVVTVGGRRHEVVIDRVMNETFYIETDAASVPVSLTLGNSVRRTDVLLTEAASVEERSSSLFIFVLAAVILLLIAVFFWRRRSRWDPVRDA